MFFECKRGEHPTVRRKSGGWMKQWGNYTKTFRKELFSTLLWLEDLAPANRLWKWYADLTERSDSGFFLVFHWWFVARRFQQQPEVGQLSWLVLVFFAAFPIKNTFIFSFFFPLYNLFWIGSFCFHLYCCRFCKFVFLNCWNMLPTSSHAWNDEKRRGTMNSKSRYGMTNVPKRLQKIYNNNELINTWKIHQNMRINQFCDFFSCRRKQKCNHLPSK